MAKNNNKSNMTMTDISIWVTLYTWNSYTEKQNRLYTLGGPEVVILFPGSHLHLNSTISLDSWGRKSSAPHPLKIPSFNSIILNISIYDPITFKIKKYIIFDIRKLNNTK